MTDWVITILAGVVIAIGIAGVILPILPGLWLIWVAALVYGLVIGFDAWAWAAMALITVLAAAGTGIVYYLPARETTRVGVPRWGQVLIAGFAIVGFFVVPVVGAFLGLALGAFLVALVVERDVGDAVGTAWTTLVEMLKGAAAQLVAALLMALVWGLWAYAVLA